MPVPTAHGDGPRAGPGSRADACARVADGRRYIRRNPLTP
jgi:hypothetical protein